MPRITLQLSQEDGIGTLHFNGEEYECGGNSSFDYPEDSTISGYKEYCHYSRENDFVMHYAVLWDGTYGTYFHEADSLYGSAGCIHLLEGDAKSFYDDINGKARVIFEWTE